jgi:hypothetical protein
VELLQLAWKEAAIAPYEAAFEDKKAQDELVQPSQVSKEAIGTSIQREPLKFESKWFETYKVVQKVLLGTYRLQDPNSRELSALAHGNQLIEATVRTADELKEL